MCRAPRRFARTSLPLTISLSRSCSFIDYNSIASRVHGLLQRDVFVEGADVSLEAVPGRVLPPIRDAAHAVGQDDVHLAWVFAVSVAEALVEVRLFVGGAEQGVSLEGGRQLRVLLDGAHEVLLDQSILDPFRGVQLGRYDMPLALTVQLAIRFNVQHGGN